MTTMPYPSKSPDSEPDPRIFNAEGQTFLIGDTIFLRSLEPEDKARPSAWRDSPYPIGTERAGEILKEYFAGGGNSRRMVACRRTDGVPVGSIKITSSPGNLFQRYISLYADPAQPYGEAVKGEMLRVVTEWAFGEAEMPAIFVDDIDVDQRELIATAESLGMRRSAQWREQRWRDGQFRDKVAYQAFHPVWLKRLGDPGVGIEHAVAPDDSGRWRPRQFPTFGTIDGDPPVNAVMVGPRVYLRALQASDAANYAMTSRREPDTFFDDGRYPRSAGENRHFITSAAKDDLPESIRLAVCLRETGENIGSTGILDIDRVNRTAQTATFFHDPAYRNQGYGSEAKQLLLAYAFDRLGLHSVYSWVWGPNTRSAAALRKQGYRDAGRVFWEGTKDGEVTFDNAFDLLASEWREMTARAAAEQLAVAR